MANAEVLRAEIVEQDGFGWVQIVDDYGFAGYDPSDDQIAQAAAKHTIASGMSNEAMQAYAQRLKRHTRIKHETLARLGFLELTGLDLPESRSRRRNKDVVNAAKQMDWSSTDTMPIYRYTDASSTSILEAQND